MGIRETPQWSPHEPMSLFERRGAPFPSATSAVTSAWTPCTSCKSRHPQLRPVAAHLENRRTHQYPSHSGGLKQIPTCKIQGQQTPPTQPARVGECRETHLPGQLRLRSGWRLSNRIKHAVHIPTTCILVTVKHTLIYCKGK